MTQETAILDPYFAALCDGDEAAAVTYALSLVDRGVDPVDVLLDVIAPAQELVGRRWAAGEWSVAREHAATAISEAATAALAARIRRAERSRGHVVVACAEREWHGLPARMVAHALRAAGWHTTYLGASTPPAQLARYLDDVGADAVAISSSVAASLPAARRMIEAVREAGLPVLVGGRAFGPDGTRAAALGADAWAANATDAVAVMERLVSAGDCGSMPLPCDARHAGLDEHAELVVRFAEFRGAIRARDWGGTLRDRGGTLDDLGGTVRSGRPDDPNWPALADDAVEHALHALSGALLADDPSILVEAREWLDGLFRARGYDSRLAEGLWRVVRAEVAPFLARATRHLDALYAGTRPATGPD